MKYIKDNWFKTREFIYLSLLALEIFLSLLFRTTFNMKTPLGYLLSSFQLFYIPVLVGVLYVADILMTGIRNNIKKVIIDGFIGVFFIIAAYTSLDFNLLATGVFLVSSDKSSVKNIAKTIAVTLLFGTLLFGVFSQIGIIDDRLTDRFGRIAHGFGFRRYAFPARQLLFVLCAYIGARVKKISWAELIVQAGLIWLIYYYTTQRVTLIVFVAVWVLYIVTVKYEFIRINTKFVEFCSLTGFSVFGIFSVTVSYFYNESVWWMSKLNSFVNNRVVLGWEAFNRYDVNLFGQEIVTDTIGEFGSFFYIDNGYLDVLFSYGLILFIITTILYTVILWYSCRKNEKGLFIWMTATMIYNFIDNAWLDMIATGVGVILFGAVLNELRKEKAEKLKLPEKYLSE
ncbi:MAG: hypothetical protein IJN69_07930 [Oscillospiraceae bacterium]|nr:hypothetical protein [Oscillospiraceae bacterium]